MTSTRMELVTASDIGASSEARSGMAVAYHIRPDPADAALSDAGGEQRVLVVVLLEFALDVRPEFLEDVGKCVRAARHKQPFQVVAPLARIGAITGAAFHAAH